MATERPPQTLLPAVLTAVVPSSPCSSKRQEAERIIVRSLRSPARGLRPVMQEAHAVVVRR